MTFQQFTEKHIETLRNRLLEVGCPTKENATVGYLSNLCLNYSLSIDIEPATVMIRVCDGISEVSAAQGVRVILIDLDLNTSDKAEAEFDRLWDCHLDGGESIDMTVTNQFIED